MCVLTGRYGPYVQLGEVSDDNKKPKRTSLPKGRTPERVDFDTALQLLALPRTLGDHPETGKVVKAGVGRFGPYVVHDGKFKSLKASDDLLTIGLDRAVELLAEASGGRRGSSAIQELGNHPGTETSIRVMSGKYGPYIKYGKKNISLPKGADPQTYTLDEAVALIEEKGKT